jgi:DNA-binding IclR family transcriptional regulator
MARTAALDATVTVGVFNRPMETHSITRILAAADDKGKPVGALVAGLKVLRYINAADRPVGVSKVARDLSLNPSTCFNLLRTLVRERLAVFDSVSKTYGPGIGLVELAAGAIDRVSPIAVIRPYLRRIADTHDVTTMFWQRSSETRVVLVATAESRAAVRVQMSVGHRLPVLIGALGRCVAAYEGYDRETLRERLRDIRWDNPPSFADYYQDCDAVHARGYAVDRGHFYDGVTTVAVALRGSDGRAIMALSGVGLMAQIDNRRIAAVGRDLVKAAGEIAQSIGVQPPATGAGERSRASRV